MVVVGCILLGLKYSSVLPNMFLNFILKEQMLPNMFLNFIFQGADAIGVSFASDPNRVSTLISSLCGLYCL